MIFFIPEPDDKARQKIDLKIYGRLWIISYHLKSLRGPLQIISYYIKGHSAGPSVNVDIFLAKVKIVRLQIFSCYIT